jgi:Family of unknown function (DUF5693)
LSKNLLRLTLSILLTISIIPALLMAWQRVQFERSYDTLGLVMDYDSVLKQARENGLGVETLLEKYKALGVGGVSIYESTLGRLVQNDAVVFRDGSSWRNDRISLGRDVSQIISREVYVRSIVVGTAERFTQKYKYKTRRVLVDGQQWIAFPLDVFGNPAGPDLALIGRVESLGLFVAYRPFDQLAISDPGADFPKVPFIIYGGDTVSGSADETKLKRVQERTTGTITGLVEATDQLGIDVIAKVNPTVRVFAIRPEWQALLKPEEVASKFVLAARERNHRLLYLRPFLRIDDTETFLKQIKIGLDKAQLKIGKPGPLEFTPNPMLRRLSIVGPVLALALLATCFSSVWLGVAVALGTLGVCLLAGGIGYSGAALAAACVFPTLGFAMARETPVSWLRATLVTVMGALFVAALGTARNEILSLEPFRGVALTLALPPLLLALTMLPNQDIRKTLRDLWNVEINLGTLGLALIALAAIALVLSRRGNTPSVGVSATEAKVRAALQDSIIRPRTKELLLHPAALLGTARGWPLWFSNLLLLAGVIGQGSIIDSFAHYHTPLIISLLRTVNGIFWGGLIGFVVIPISVIARGFMARAPGAFGGYSGGGIGRITGRTSDQ